MKSFFRNNKGVVFIILVFILPIILGTLYFGIDYSELKNSENYVRAALISSLNQVANSDKKTYKEYYKTFVNKFVFELSPDNIDNLITEEEKFSDPVHKCTYKCSVKESFFKTKLYEQKYNTFIDNDTVNYYKNYIIGKVINGIKANNSSVVVIDAGNFILSEPSITTFKPPIYDDDYGNGIKFFSDHPGDYSYKLWHQPWVFDEVDLTSKNSVFNNEKFKGIFWEEYITNIYTYNSIAFDLHICNLRSISSDLNVDGCSQNCYLSSSNEYIKKFYVSNQTLVKDRLSVNLSSLKLFIADVSDKERNISCECVFDVKRYTSSKNMTKKISFNINVKKIDKKDKYGNIAIAFPISSADNLKNKISKFLKNIVNKVDYKISVIPFSPNIKLPQNMLNDKNIVHSYNNINDSVAYEYAYIYDYFINMKILYSELIKIGTCGYVIKECKNCRSCNTQDKFPVLSYDGTNNKNIQSIFSMIRNANNFLGHRYNSRGFNIIEKDSYSNNFFYYPIPTFMDNNNILYFGSGVFKNNDAINVLKDDKCFIYDSYNTDGKFSIYGECNVDNTDSDNWFDGYIDRISKLFSIRYLNSKIDDKDYFFDEYDELDLITNSDNIDGFWDSLDYKETDKNINYVFNKCIIIPYVGYKVGYIDTANLYINGFKNDYINDKVLNIVCINGRKIDAFSKKHSYFNTIFDYYDDKYKTNNNKLIPEFVKTYINNGMLEVEDLLFSDPSFFQIKTNNYPVPYVSVSTFSDESKHVSSGAISNARFVSLLIKAMRTPKFWKFCPRCNEANAEKTLTRSVYCNKISNRCYNKFLENNDEWIINYKKDFYNNVDKKDFEVNGIKTCSYATSTECRNGGFYKKNYYPGENKEIQEQIVDSKNGNIYQFNESVCSFVTLYEIIWKILKYILKNESDSFINSMRSNTVVIKDLIEKNHDNKDKGLNIYMTMPVNQLNNFIEYIRNGFYLDNDNLRIYDRAVYKEFVRGIKKIDIFSTIDDTGDPIVSSGAFSPYDYRDLHGSIEKITITTPYDYINYAELSKNFDDGNILKSNISPIKYIPFNFSQSVYLYVIGVKDANPDTGLLNINSEYIQDTSENMSNYNDNVMYIGENLTDLSYPIDNLIFLNNNPAVGVGETSGIAIPILKNSDNINHTVANGPYTALYISDSFPVNPYAILPLSDISHASAYISLINKLDIWKSNFNHLGLLWAAKMLLSSCKSFNNVSDGTKIIIFFITKDDEFVDNELTYYGFFNDEKKISFPTLLSMKTSYTKQNHKNVEKKEYKNTKKITKDSLKKATEDLIDKINSTDGDDKINLYIIDTREQEDTNIKSKLNDNYFHATDSSAIELALEKIKNDIISEENYIKQTKISEIKISEY